MSTRRVPEIQTTVTHECGFSKTSRTPGLAARALEQHSCERQQELKDRAARVEARKNYEGVKRDCQCKIANHQHGERAAYIVDGCRCRPCIDSGTAYESNRRKQVAFGRHDTGRVDARPVREHMRYLMENGISTKRMAKLTGLALSTIGAILWGRHERGHDPYPRVMKKTADKILALKPELELMSPGRNIDSTGTIRRLQALVAIGWSQNRLAKQLGMERSNFGALMRADQCTAARALAVRKIYERCWDQPQAGTEWHSKTAATRALNHAAARGWVPPMAWDDDSIDDPATKPNKGDRVRLRDTIADDVEFLHSTGAGRDEIAQRLGRTWDTVERQLHRMDRADLIALVKNDTRENARQARKGHAA